VLGVVIFYSYAECRYFECRYAECRGALSNSPSGAEIRVEVGEGGTVLAEVAVHGRRKTLERDAKILVQTLENGDGKRALASRI
jgi:hypothetical protein